MQVWDCHENKKDGSTFRNAATGEVLFQVKSSIDVGRCMAADVEDVYKRQEWDWLTPNQCCSTLGHWSLRVPSVPDCNDVFLAVPPSK